MPTDKEPEIFDPQLDMLDDHMDLGEFNNMGGNKEDDVSETLKEVTTPATPPATNVKEATLEEKRKYAFEKLKGKQLEKLQETVVSNPEAQNKILSTIDEKINALVEKKLLEREQEVKKREVLNSYSNGDKDVENLILETLQNDIKGTGDYETDIKKAVKYLMAESVSLTEANTVKTNTQRTASSVETPPKDESYLNAPGLRGALRSKSDNPYSNY